MPRYYFDVAGPGDALLADAVGVVLNNDMEAKREGRIALAEMVRDELLDGDAAQPVRLCIRDEEGRMLATLTIHFDDDHEG